MSSTILPPPHANSIVLGPAVIKHTPLSKDLFQNLQIHGSILGHNETDVPHGNSLVTAATQDTAAAHATGDSEVRILLDDITEKDIDLYFTQHLLASERSFEGMT